MPRPALVAISLAVMLLSCGKDANAPSNAPTDAPATSDASDTAPPTDGSPTAAYDTVIIHAQLFDATGDALGITDGAITAIGSTDALGAACVSPCVLVDGKGGFLTPGFHDAHVHVYTAGSAQLGLVIPISSSLAAVQSLVKDWATAHPTDPWIIGRGWNVARFGALPTHADLDAIVSDRPVALADSSGHNTWVNAAAMRLAGVTAATKDPPGGRIVRDATGAPTGMFEDAAGALIVAKEPPPTVDDMTKAIQLGESMALSVGITSTEGSGVPLAAAKVYASLDAAGKLKQRAFLWGPLGADAATFQAWVDFAHSLPKDGKVQVVAFKGFADGTLLAHTAALLAPYTDQPSTSGDLYFTRATLGPLVLRANRAGFPVAIHAIGDAAVRVALDAYEDAKTTLGTATPVNRVEHIVLVDPADVPRFSALGVAASVQPIWLNGYARMATFLPATTLGAQRAGGVYAWKKLADAGAMLLFGSDLPASTIYDPVTGIFAAVSRQLGDGSVFAIDQAFDPDDALRAYTLNPAKAIGWADRIGRLAVGWRADLVLLTRDPRRGVKSTKDDPIVKTWIAGVAVTP